MFYKKVDLPLIPEEFLLEHNFLLEREVNDIGYGNIFLNKKEKLKSCKYSTYVIQNPNFLEWLVKNIDGVSYKSGIRLQQSYSEKNGTHIVHSDIDRLFALNYIFDTGGEKVTTNWYWEKNKPLFRTKPHGGTQSDTGYIDYKNLDLLDSVIMEKNKWYILDVRILHDVQNISGYRKSISIGFNNFILNHMALG